MTEALVDHIRTHLAALDRLEQHGYAFPARTVKLLATAERKHLAVRIRAALALPVQMEALEHAYYDGLRFMIDAGTSAGEFIPLVDGGAFDWLRKLGSNRKLTFVASGMGSQLAACLYLRSG